MGQIIEQVTGARYTGSTASVTVADLQSGDVLLVFGSTNEPNAWLTGVSGCGATWTKLQNNSSIGFVAEPWIGVGATSAGEITGTGPSMTHPNGRRLTALVLRDVSADGVQSVVVSGNGTVTTSPPISAAAGSVVAGVGYSDTAENAITGTSPASDWIYYGPADLDSNFPATRWIEPVARVPAATEDHTISATRASSACVALVALAPTGGGLAATLPALTADLSGTYTAPPPPTYVGDLAATLPVVGASLSGTYQAPPAGGFTATFPAPTASLSGTYEAPVTSTPLGLSADTAWTLSGAANTRLFLSARADWAVGMLPLYWSASASWDPSGRVLYPDAFADRVDWLSGESETAAFDMSVGNSLESGEPTASGLGGTWWLEFTEGDTSATRRTAVTAPGSDVRVRVYRSTAEDPAVNQLTAVAGFGTDLQYETEPGLTYYVQVGLFSGTGADVTVAHWLLDPQEGETSEDPIEVEDDYGSTDVPVGPVETGEPLPSGASGESGWTSWTAPDPAPSEVTFRVESDAATFHVAVYTGDLADFGSLVQVVSASGTAESGASAAFTPAGGLTYHIQVVGPADASFSVTWYPAPGVIIEAEPARHLRVEVYERDGLTRITEVPRRFGALVSVQLNTPGAGGFTIHAHDPILEAYPNLLKFGNVVKFWLGNYCAAGVRIQKRVTSYVTTEEFAGYVIDVSGPTLEYMLDDFIVSHDGPRRADSLDTRAYSWASRPGPWYDPDEWTDPLADAPLDDPPGGVHNPRTPAKKRQKWGFPKKWPDPEAKWTFYTGNESAAAVYGSDIPPKRPGRRHSFVRRNFKVANNGTLVRIHATADESFEVYLDGEEIIRETNSEFGYKSFAYYDTRLSAGVHTIAVHTLTGTFGVKNLDRNDSFLLSVMEIASDGSMGKALVRSNRRWKAWIGANPPGWNRAQVLINAVNEAKARGVDSAQLLHFGFTTDEDSEGRKWTDRFNKDVQIGTSGLDLAAQLAEGFGFDYWVGPVGMKLYASRRRGTDKSGSITLEPGRNLLNWEVEETDEIRNLFLVQHRGGWVDAKAPASIRRFGEREAYVELGTVRDGRSARQLMRKILQGSERHRVRAGTPEVVRRRTGEFEGGLIPVRGAWPFLDFHVGDVVKVPGSDGQLVRQRVLGITCVEDQEGNLSFDAEFDIQDGPSPVAQRGSRGGDAANPVILPQEA